MVYLIKDLYEKDFNGDREILGAILVKDRDLTFDDVRNMFEEKKEEMEKENGEYCICEIIDALIKENPNTLNSINLSTMYIYE